MARPIQILLITDDPQQGQRWSQWLDGLPHLALVDSTTTPCGSPPHIIIADRTPLGDRAAKYQPWLSTGEIGVVQVGGKGPADVALPTDVTRRELELACRLLAEIVRLRRDRRAVRRQQDRLRQLAATDPLTGLANRRGWDEQLAAQLADRRLRKIPLCLAVFDLDHFKRVNDQHGHATGDAVLRAAGQALAVAVRDGDLVARLGGDEFGLALHVPDADTARQVVQRVRQALNSTLARAELPTVTASAGLALPAAIGTTDAPSLFDVADAALRQAKADGRDRLVCQAPVHSKAGSQDA